MRLVSFERDGAIAEMQSDGAIYTLWNGKRRFVGRVSNDVLVDAHGTPTLTCAHREVGLPGTEAKGHYDERDDFVDDHRRITILDDGMVSTNGESSMVRVEGPIAKTRRTAVLLVIAAFPPRPRGLQ